MKALWARSNSSLGHLWPPGPRLPASAVEGDAAQTLRPTSVKPVTLLLDPPLVEVGTSNVPVPVMSSAGHLLA